MFLTGVISAAAGVRVISKILLTEMFTKVRMDLNTAHFAYAQSLQDVERTVRLMSERFDHRSSGGGLLSRDEEARLNQARETEGLDILALLDRDGRVLQRRGIPGPVGGAKLDIPLLRTVSKQPRVLSSTILMTSRELEPFGRGLSARAAIPLVAASAPRQTDSGLLLASVAPVRGAGGGVQGTLFGARLLSRDNGLVDATLRMLYKDMKRRGRDIGVVTLFQGDVRVATTLQTPEGRRALGTRGTAQALGMAPTQDSPQVERADALGTWYLTAHETISDFEGRPLGSLFVGVLESLYTDRYRQVLLIFLSVVACGMAAALLVGTWISRSIVKPLRALTETAQRLAAGDFSSRARLRADDEFGDLGAAFDSMALSIQRNELQVKRDVERHIADSERLAMVGQLAAGIAHEINNPLGGVLVYSHLLLDDTPEDDPRRSNLKKIAQETARCRDIVRSLLDFARQGELQVEDADLHTLITQSLELAGTQKSFRGIRIVKRFGSGVPRIPLDRGKIQQVLLNVIFNAAEAMAGREGVLRVSTRNVRGGEAVQIRMRDGGCGMPAEVLKRVFEPFFTTKEVGKGVGLGLSVSYGIVERHSGRLRIRSRPGQGTVVSILLPAR
jgi:two-component system NtrC family sensor kinase